MKYNISYYKASNKKMPTSNELSEFVHRINQLAFQLNNAYTIKGKTARIGKSLSQIGIELAELKVNDKYSAKKNEILQYLRNTVLQLRTAYKQPDNLGEVQKTLNYYLSRAIDFSRYEHTPQEILEKILQLKELKTDMGATYANLNSVQFEKMIDELKDDLYEKLN